MLSGCRVCDRVTFIPLEATTLSLLQIELSQYFVFLLCNLVETTCTSAEAHSLICASMGCEEEHPLNLQRPFPARESSSSFVSLERPVNENSFTTPAPFKFYSQLFSATCPIMSLYCHESLCLRTDAIELLLQ